MKANQHSLNSAQPNSGFTLVELLVATSLTGLIATLAGFGLVAILQSQKETSVEVAQRTNLNRAIDFIADDVRMAKTISTTVASGELPSAATLPCGSSSTVTGILKLTMPDNSKVVYYLNNLSSATGCPSWLLKPAVIYRCSFGAVASQCSNAGNVLVDAVQANSSTPSCSNATDTSGFYASPSSTTSRAVDICLRGQLLTAYGAAASSPYTVRSQVSARAF